MKRSKPLPRATAPLKRSAPPQRKARVKQRRATKRRRPEGHHDPLYMDAVRKLPCLYYCGSCEGSIEAHHMGVRGLGQKCPDDETVPFCSHHHRSWHDCSGVFAGWPRERRRAYSASSIAWTQKVLGYMREAP